MLGRVDPQALLCMVQRAHGDREAGNLGSRRSPISQLSITPFPGRNEPLKKERPKWKSDYPMTDGQLRSKRDEFWDTAPAFEGRKEIWDALKAAAYAVEVNDHSLAQAILDGASITLPHGEGWHWGMGGVGAEFPTSKHIRIPGWRGVPSCHPCSSAQPRQGRQDGLCPAAWGGPIPI